MILDIRALLSDKQAIVASAPSTNIYDLLETGTTYDGVKLQRHMGRGGHIPLLVQVNQEFDELTSLTFAFETDDDDTFAAAVEVFRCVVPLAQLKEGFILPIERLPRNLMKRFFRMNYIVDGTAPTSGLVTAGIVAAVDGSYQG